jgi:flagellar protein FliS
MKPPTQTYQAYNAATQTVAKTRQIVMLYDGVIRFMQQAKEAIRDKRIEDRYHILTRASDVVIGLQSCLDFDQGGEVARILYNFYSTMNARIFSIHRSASLETCDQVIAEMKQMRDSWDAIDQGSTSGATPSPATPAPATKPDSPDQTIILSA